MTMDGSPRQRIRRRLLQGGAALALVPWLSARGAERDIADIPALAAFLAGRTPRWERMRLDLPALADNGQAVPMKIAVDGPFAPGPYVRVIRLFSQRNPVPEMATFEFPVAVERIEVESRIRLAGTQRVVAVATLSDGVLYAVGADVVVTIDACMDGT
ncbi:MAG: thiosulfate oxidation carrier protein SoxY [Betaproteobacteria bacterium]